MIKGGLKSRSYNKGKEGDREWLLLKLSLLKR